MIMIMVMIVAGDLEFGDPVDQLIGGETGGGLDDPDGELAVLEDSGESGLQPKPIEEDHIRPLHPPDIPGAELEVVRPYVGREETGNVGPITRDIHAQQVSGAMLATIWSPFVANTAPEAHTHPNSRRRSLTTTADWSGRHMVANSLQELGRKQEARRGCGGRGGHRGAYFISNICRARLMALDRRRW